MSNNNDMYITLPKNKLLRKYKSFNDKNIITSYNSSENKKKYKSLNYSSISNISSLKKTFNKDYPNKNDENNTINVTIFFKKSKLYIGTHFNFINNNIDEYYKYYDKKRKGTYFLSSDTIASTYGKNRDFSNIVYTTIPDSSLIKKPTNIHEYIYPLYYNKDIRGSNIVFKLNNNLFLLNIGDIKVVSKLWHIINNSTKLSKEEKEKYFNTLYATCAKFDINKGINNPPIETLRRSYDDDDNDLVDMFLDFFIPLFKEDYNVDIDGWIYYFKENNKFHDEIFIKSREKLDFKKISTFKSSEYKDIPTREEFLKSLENKKVKNNSSIEKFTILNNLTIVYPPKK